MSKEMFGLIHDYYPMQKMISIVKDNKISFFYFTKSTYKIFLKSMEHKSVFIHFEYNDTTKTLKGYEAYQITEISKISYQSHRGLIDIYSSETIREKVSSIINKHEYKMFMDFELTMPSYDEKESFTPELLQIGCVIVDEFDEVINFYSNYIKTNKEVSDRTKKFLHIFDSDLEESIEIKDFYNDYKDLIEIYDPTIYVWGTNDTIGLNNFYKINDYKPIKARYVDLLKEIRNYFKLHKDIGLFTCLKEFNDIDARQAHHALTDAAATKEVYDSFKKIINGKLDKTLNDDDNIEE